MKLRNIDLFKGLLILLVIIGHILQGKTLCRDLIYSFHMPLFIGVSSFLFNVNKVKNFNLIELTHKYKYRIIFPWIIAVAVYFMFSAIQGNKGFNTYDILASFFNPFYHLWFIPGFLSWVLLTWIMKKMQMSNRVILIFSFIVSCIAMILLKNPIIYQGFGKIEWGLKLALYTFRFQFYFFFVLGFVYRNKTLNLPKMIEYFLVVFLFLFLIYMYYFPNKQLYLFTFFIFNVALLNIVLKISSHQLINSVKSIEWLGQNSLGIYLWHVLPIVIVGLFIDKSNVLLFYALVVLLEVVLFFVYKYLLRFTTIKKYFFGL